MVLVYHLSGHLFDMDNQIISSIIYHIIIVFYILYLKYYNYRTIYFIHHNTLERMFNIWLGIYIVFTIILGIGGISYFVKTSRMVSAGIYLVGAIAIFIIFGIRWFAGSNPLFGVPSPVQWPPVVNTCPDFLTYMPIKNMTGTTLNTCIDRIGVSKNGNLKKYPSTGGTTNPKDTSYLFILPSLNVSDPSIRQQLCQMTIQYGLTWEGITDGESCITPSGTNTIPVIVPTPTCPPPLTQV